MIPNSDGITEIHRRYAQNDAVFDLVFTHCKIVTEIAEWCVTQKNLTVDADILRAGCMLHDIGTYALFDEHGITTNDHNYKQHALFGSALILEEGFDARIASIVKTHVLLGLTKKEIIAHGFGMPQRDYVPATIEGRLLCYADRFHSKHPTFNAYKPFLERLSQGLPEQAEKLQTDAEEFGIPDVESLAKKYNHPVRV